jgi:hypothetical protein
VFVPNLPKSDDQSNSKSFAVLSHVQFSNAKMVGDTKRRTFAGIAYSGGVILEHWYWGNVVFDLGSMAVPDKLPALIDHDRAQRCGYVTGSSIDFASGLTVNGVLLSNEAGAAMAAESDEGFPWQMSVHIEPGVIEEVQAGANVTVNGTQHVGPITVFKNSRIVEVSFTATGWDAHTSAIAMSRGLSNSETAGDSMESKETQDKVAAMEAQLLSLKTERDQLAGTLQAAQLALEKFGRDAREKDVHRLFSDLGIDPKKESEDLQKWVDLPQAAFDFMAEKLRAQHKPADQSKRADLFSHVATTSQASKTEPVISALVANAQQRAALFSKPL